MGVNEIITMITQLGFPCVVALVCFWYINKMTTEHKEEVDKLSEALNNNTLVMQKLVDKLGDVE